MAFIDEVKLHIKAGDGGDGVVRWKREKFKPKAGPGGGNGGRGGDVYAEAVSDLAYLEFYRHKKKFKADDGEPGANFSKEGAYAEDLTLKFPRGSLITNLDSGEKFDLREVGERVLLLRGGRGGLGNEHFKSSTNVTPRESTPGKPGAEADFYIELALFADIGLLGFPSVGKSTLLNSITNADSKTGAYHFTTLEPYLGVMEGGIVIADIPGLIEGASDGKGLGHKFLKHIKRTKALAHLISAETENPFADYKILRNELAKYDSSLLEKKELIILSKGDLLPEKEFAKKIKTLAKETGEKVIGISAYDEKSLQALKKEFANMLK